MDLAEGCEMGPALSLPSPARSSALSQGLEAHFAVTSTQVEAPVLQLSRSLDVFSIETGDIESWEVVTPAVAKLSIEWPAEKQEVQQKSKLDKRFFII